MGNNNPGLEIEIILPDGTVKQAFAKINSESKKVSSESTKELEKPFVNMKTVAVASIAAVTTAFYGMKKAIDAAIVQEEAVNDFNTSLRLSGRYSKEASLEFQEFASQLQRNSVVGDEVILKNAALIQNLGKLSDDALKDATQAALDLSAALGLDVATASTLVGKAAAGEVGSFSRFGLSIKKAATDAETFDNALRSINQSFGGAAAAKILTYSGATKQLDNDFGDLLEEIGKLVTESPGAVKSINDTSNAIVKLSGYVKENADEIRAMAKAIVEFPIVKLEGLIKFLDGGEVTSRAEQIALVTKEIEKQEKILASYEEQKASALSAKEDESFFARAERAIADFLGADYDKSIDENVEKTKNKISELKSKIQELASVPIVNEPVKLGGNELPNSETPELPNLNLSDFTKGFSAGFENETKKTQKSLDALKKDFVEFGKTTKDVMLNGFGAGVANGFASVGKALVEGDNALKAFGKAFIGSIGQMLIQEGTAFILKGIAYSANPLTPGIGGPMIAAGSTMAVAGGAMSALAGGGASSSGSSSGASAVTYADTGTTTEIGDYEERERQAVSPTFNFEINGFVGNNKDEVTFAIAESLKEMNLFNGVTT
jgi:hypothetical protein